MSFSPSWTATVSVAYRIKPKQLHLSPEVLHNLAPAYLSRLISLLHSMLYIWNISYSFLPHAFVDVFPSICNIFLPILPSKIFPILQLVACAAFQYFVILDYEIIFIDEIPCNTLYCSCLCSCHANWQPQPLFSSNHTLPACHQWMPTGRSYHLHPHPPATLTPSSLTRIHEQWSHTTSTWHQQQSAPFLATTSPLLVPLHHPLGCFCSYLLLCLDCFHPLVSASLLLYPNYTKSPFISQLNHWSLRLGLNPILFASNFSFTDY